MKTKVLADFSSTSKKNPWQPKKRKSRLLADSYERNHYLSAMEKVKECGSDLEFAVMESEEKRLISANFCKDRLCPLCMWRKSKKIYHQVEQVYDLTSERFKNLSPILLTLTVRNSSASELQSTIDEMMTAWNRMTQNRRFKNRIIGYFRALEVTYDHDVFITEERYEDQKEFYDRKGLQIGDKNPNFDTYHPHFHIILFVDEKSYYSHKKDLYMNQRSWQDFWRKSARLDYDPIVDIRAIKGDPKKAIAEVAKYTLKDSDIFDQDLSEEKLDEVILTLKCALSYRRLFSFGGILKEISKELDQDELGEGDLVNIENKENTEKVIRIEKYSWRPWKNNYFMYELIDEDPLRYLFENRPHFYSLIQNE